MRWIGLLLFSVISFSVLAIENEGTIRAMERRTRTFASELSIFDVMMQEVRSHVEAGDLGMARDAASVALAERSVLLSLWSDIDHFYERNKIAFSKLKLWRDQDQVDPFFLVYLTMKRNGSTYNGSPLDLLMRSWIGLQYGIKSFRAPATAHSEQLIGETWVRRGDPVVIMTVNGGMIRGQVLGFTPSHFLVLQELLPVVLSHYQRKGAYRVIPLDQSIARVERLRQHHASQKWTAATTTIDRKGNYSKNKVNSELAQRIDLNMDDATLLSHIKKGEWDKLKRDPSSSNIPSSELQPAYTRMAFEECRLLLDSET